MNLITEKKLNQLYSSENPLQQVELKIHNDEDKTSFTQLLICPMFLPLFIETTILDDNEDKHSGLPHVLNLHNINHRICKAKDITNIQDTINEGNKEHAEAVGKMFTLVPYKVQKKQLMKETHGKTIGTIHIVSYLSHTTVLKKNTTGIRSVSLITSVVQFMGQLRYR